MNLLILFGGYELPLSEKEITRYERQLILKGWSLKKQESLKMLSFLVSSNYPSLLFYLSALGVGKLNVVL